MAPAKGQPGRGLRRLDDDVDRIGRIVRFLRNLFNVPGGEDSNPLIFLGGILLTLVALGGAWLATRGDDTVIVAEPSVQTPEVFAAPSDQAAPEFATDPVANDSATAAADDESADSITRPADEEAADSGDDAPLVIPADEPNEQAAPPLALEPTDEAQATQPAVDPTVDPIATAVGTYRISEDSARRALEPNVTSFESAVGLLEISNDGTVSGTFTLVYWAPWQNVHDNALARAIADVTLNPASLVRTDSGFTFEGTIHYSMLIVWDDQVRNADRTYPVSGEVMPEVGVIELSMPAGAGAVEFRR